jgi:putative flippase GtrA
MGGLVSKYFLDKKYIFLDMDHSYVNNRNKFFLYSLNGILTTIIFWSSESLFYFLFQSHFAREIGAILGLTVGYILKYRLDKKFVFKLGMEA